MSAASTRSPSTASSSTASLLSPSSTPANSIAKPKSNERQLSALLSLAVQLSVNQMVRRVLLVTDTAYLGRLGTKELAGVALANLWINVPFNFVQYAVPAISILGSQAFGAEDYAAMGSWLQTSVVFALVSCVPVGLVHVFVGDLISLTMTDSATVAFGTEYGRILATALVPRYLYSCLSAYFATIDVVQASTVCSVVTMLLNIALNQLLIYGVGTWRGLGFAGSPWATVISSYVQLLLFASYTMLWKRYHVPYWGGWSKACVSRLQLHTFLALALPMGASSAVDWSSLTVAGMVLATLSPEVSAANAVLFGLFGVAYACVSGFAAATQIFMSRAIGLGSMVAAKHALLHGTFLMTIVAAALIIVIAAAPAQILALWTRDVRVVDLCRSVLGPFLVSVALIFYRFLLSSSANAVELSRWGFHCNNFGAWIVFVPLTYVAVINGGWGLTGYWVANALGEVVKIVLLVWGLQQKNWSGTPIISVKL
ncbi:hypothetical protein ACHHYP_14069 [Achlya hypogyna]|uniref:Multidrug/Oligosaccharidyl-lipid/Polysaccharide (MOP) Flippase Superfamily n=1 Tax=Achlya hypogyna TaxID=1202772 RepID=A0A1V9YDZ2_ACHHY|nr:hypothetical protein ACHHYP_14069 [Achlya hypogyna]